MTRRSKRAAHNRRLRANTHPIPEERPMPRPYQYDDEPQDFDEQDRNAAASERISNLISEHNHEMMLDEEELEGCDTCGYPECICDEQIDEDEEETNRYIDKRLSDREDFHSDDARFPSYDDEPYYPEY